MRAMVLTAPRAPLVPAALRAVAKGGTVVCAGIHMSDIPSFPYEILWGERVVRSVANLTRRDGEEFLALAPTIQIRTQVTPYALDRADAALDDLRAGRIAGAGSRHNPVAAARRTQGFVAIPDTAADRRAVARTHSGELSLHPRPEEVPLSRRSIGIDLG